MNKKYTYIKKGFTLVETMVSVAILLVSILPALTIAHRGVILGNQVKSEFVASFLAQEAIEFVRHHIAYNASIGAVGIDQLTESTGHDLTVCNNSYCTIDARPTIPFSSSLASCVGDCPSMIFDPVTQLYGQGAGSTQYVRTVTILSGAGDGPSNLPFLFGNTEFEIVVEVEFGNVDERRSLVIKEIIYDWRRK